MGSKIEITGHRCLAYSAWHRIDSISRYVGRTDAVTMTMVDIDCAYWVESNRAGTVLGLIETTKDNRMYDKPCYVLLDIAQRMTPTVFCGVLYYTLSRENNPAQPTQRDISCFVWQQFWPKKRYPIRYSPEKWAKRLLHMRAMIQQYEL